MDCYICVCGYVPVSLMVCVVREQPTRYTKVTETSTKD